jgi:catechol-2,3-dioxygenase
MTGKFSVRPGGSNDNHHHISANEWRIRLSRRINEFLRQEMFDVRQVMFDVRMRNSK